MSSALSSRSRCALVSAAVAAGSSRGGAVVVPARRRAAKQGLFVDRGRPSSLSTSTSTTSAATAKNSPLLPSLPSLSLPKLFFGGSRLSKAKAKLLDLISQSDRGTNVAGPSREEIETAIDELYAAAPRSALFPLENNPAGIDGKWKLVWTSEREVLWVIANGKRLFGCREVGEVFQTLNLAENANGDGDGNGKATPALINEIVFPPGGSFVVNSSARARDAAAKKGAVGSRVDFSFSGAQLAVAKVDKETGECAPAFSLSLPPFGKGWFDTVVVGGDLRIARDVRGDTLICVRA